MKKQGKICQNDTNRRVYIYIYKYISKKVAICSLWTVCPCKLYIWTIRIKWLYLFCWSFSFSISGVAAMHTLPDKALVMSATIRNGITWKERKKSGEVNSSMCLWCYLKVIKKTSTIVTDGFETLIDSMKLLFRIIGGRWRH